MSLATRIAQELNTVRGEITESDTTAVKLTGNQTIEGVKTFTSNIVGNVTGNIVGNSATATKLATPRKITISGDVSGSTSFDGSCNVTLSTQVADDSHSHSTSTITGLGTAATKNVGTGAGNVMEVGAFGVGALNYIPWPTASLNDPVPNGIYYAQTSKGFPFAPDGMVEVINYSNIWIAMTAYDLRTGRTMRRSKNNGTWSPWVDLIHTGNLAQTTGTSTEYPMSQKATTDAINTKVGLTGNQTIDGIKTFNSLINGSVTGNAGTATKLKTARTITISGDVSGNTSFDGSTDVTLSAQVANDSHNHSTSTITGLGTAATKNVGTADGNVMEVGAFGLGITYNAVAMDANTLPELYPYSGFVPLLSNIGSTNVPHTYVYIQQIIYNQSAKNVTQIAYSYNNDTVWIRYRYQGTWSEWNELLTKLSLKQSTGTSTSYPMSQKATTDAINTKVGLTGNQTIAGVKTFTESPIIPTPTTDYQSVPLRSSNITVYVGSGQTYTTINQALEYLSSFYPMYKNSGVTATIKLKAGFAMAEQVLVRGLDLGWVTIVGEDAETVINHTALTVNFTIGDYGFNSYPAFGVSKGGTLPRIGQLFRFNVAGVSGNKHGVMAVGAGSSAEILENKGIKNAGSHGIFASHGSTINANSAYASGAGYYGIYAARCSTINANSAYASGAGYYCIVAHRGSTINAYTATGTLSQTANILTNNGIIYQ